MAGFIHDKLDIKVLVLYLLSRVDAPIGFSALTDLVLAERGVDYFLFAEAAAELTGSGHLRLEDGLYSITGKGRRNSTDSESSLPAPVRRRCAARLAALNADLRRAAQVRAQAQVQGDGTCVLRLALDDGGGSLFSLELFTPSKEQAEEMAARFRAHPDEVYHKILAALLEREEES